MTSKQLLPALKIALLLGFLCLALKCASAKTVNANTPKFRDLAKKAIEKYKEQCDDCEKYKVTKLICATCTPKPCSKRTLTFEAKECKKCGDTLSCKVIVKNNNEDNMKVTCNKKDDDDDDGSDNKRKK